ATEMAAADLNRVERGMWEAAGGASRPQTESNQPRTVLVRPGARGDSSISASVQSVLNTLLLAAVVVLLVACANVANLLLARAAARGREMAMRVTLGAGAGRLVRLLTIEALFIGGVSAVLALALSRVGVQLAAPFLTTFGRPTALDLSINGSVL